METSADCGRNGGRRRTMVEMSPSRWVAVVFDAMRKAAPRRDSQVALTAVGAELGIAAEDMIETQLTAHDGVGMALMQALVDLDSLGLVDFQNVAYGNSVTQSGRDVHDNGISVLWPAIFGIHLDDRAVAFLRKLVTMSVVRRDTWAERHPVPARQVYRELGWTLEKDYDLTRDIHELVDELDTKGMLGQSGARNFGNMDVAPTYIGVVRAIEQDPEAPGRSAGILDWFDPAPRWEGVETELDEVKAKLDAATTDHDFEDLGRRVREVATDAVLHVVDLSMVPAGKEVPGDRDQEEWFAIYLDSNLPGGPNKVMRDYLRATLALANAVTHGSRHRVVGAVATSQALISLVRTLQSIERQASSRSSLGGSDHSRPDDE